MFNDFSIEPIEEHEARVLDLNFMTPVCIFFRRKNMEREYNLQLTYDSPITVDALAETQSIASTAPYLKNRRRVTFTPLGPDEVLEKVRARDLSILIRKKTSTFPFIPFSL